MRPEDHHTTTVDGAAAFEDRNGDDWFVCDHTPTKAECDRDEAS